MKTVPLRHLTRINTRVLPEETAPECSFKYIDISQVDSNGAIFTPDEQVSFGEAPSRARRLASPGDTVVSTVRTYLRAIARVPVTGEPLVFSTGFAVLEPAEVESRFLTYACRSEPFVAEVVARSTGVSYPAINPSELASIGIPVPEAQEQRRIADFLDDRVARIDRIIAGRVAQLQSNREGLRSEVEEALDGNAERVRASRVMRVRPGFAFPSDEFSHDDRDIPLLRGINVGVGSLRWEDTVYWPQNRLSEVGAFLLRQGDVVMGMDRPWIGDGLRIAQLDERDGRPLLLQRVAKLSSDGYLRARFIFWVYQSEHFRRQVESDLTGLAVPHLSGDQILGYQLPALSLSQQQSIADRLDAVQAVLTSANQLLSRSIDLLNEYKQSLITAAVTGELDVTTAGSGMPG